MKKAFAGLLLLLFTSACASIQQTSHLNGQKINEGQEPLAHIEGDIWGVYFLSFFPIVTGNPDGIDDYVWFKDTVNISNAVNLVSTRSRDLGAGGMANLHTSYDTSWRASSIRFWIKEAKASAPAVK